MARLLYITSSSHSGSTLTDLLVGSIPGAVSTGELKHLPYLLRHRHEASIENDTACSCLSSIRECPFWSRVIDSLSKRVGFDVWSESPKFKMDLMSGNYEGRFSTLRRKIERRGLYGHVIQHGFWRWLQRPWSALYRRRAHSNRLLFGEIADAAEAEVVVDSSKDIRRLNLLSRHMPGEVSVIFLMRSLPGCSHSAVRRGRELRLHAQSWVRHNNRICRLLSRLRDVPVLPVQYERLAADPTGMRRRIAEFLHLPDPGDRVEIDTRRYHLVRGNRMRYAGAIEIRPQIDWREQFDRDTIRLLRNAADKLHPRLSETGLDPFAVCPTDRPRTAPADAEDRGQGPTPNRQDIADTQP